MNTLINYLKVLLIPIGFVLIAPLIVGIFNLLGVKTINIIILIVMIITMLISGFFIGKNVNKKGYINGLAFGALTSLIFFILSLLFKNNYQINTLIYYAILIASSTVGSILGIQKKTND